MEPIKWEELLQILDTKVPDLKISGTVYGHPTSPGTVASCPDDNIILKGTPREQMEQYREWRQHPVVGYNGHTYKRRSLFRYSDGRVIETALEHLFPELPCKGLITDDILKGEPRTPFALRLIEEGKVVYEK